MQQLHSPQIQALPRLSTAKPKAYRALGKLAADSWPSVPKCDPAAVLTLFEPPTQTKLANRQTACGSGQPREIPCARSSVGFPHLIARPRVVLAAELQRRVDGCRVAELILARRISRGGLCFKKSG